MFEPCQGTLEHIAAMRAMWAPDPVSFSGRFYEIPPSYHGPKPVRGSGVPILVGTLTEPGTRRAIRFAKVIGDSRIGLSNSVVAGLAG